MIESNFEKILVEARQGILLPVLVSTEGNEFALIGLDEWANAFKVKVKSKAGKGKASQELAGKIGKAFNAKVEVLAGKKLKKKGCLLKATKQHAIERLSGLLGNQRNA